jgi:hypothetical protein
MQLKLYGILGCLITAITLSVCEDNELYDRYNYLNVFYIQKILDLVIAKALLLLTVWNFYLCFSGYSHIEYKSIIDMQT